MLPEKLAFVDIETTGTRVTHDRIIEIGIIRVEDGTITDTYQTLLKPEVPVSPYILQFTGIDSESLRQAPTLNDCLSRINDLLDGCVFVAHNARFDYGFLKNEFTRLGQSFSPDQLCTVKLSRRLYPHERRHNLTSIIERLAIPCTNRHRAYSDAEATWRFYEYIQTHFSPEQIAAAIKDCIRHPSAPLAVPFDTLQHLPESPGIYKFLDAQGYPLYIGKSTNVKSRVQSHFTNDYTASREMHIAQQVASIETVTTAGELSALILESELIKKEQPLYNRQLRQTRNLTLVKKLEAPDGYITVEYSTSSTIDPAEVESIYGVFKSLKQAKDTVTQLAKEHELCHKLLGLEKTRHACFPYQLGWCHGACLGQERPEIYNLRFALAFAAHKIQPWPFRGPIIIHEYNENEGKQEAILIDRWCLLARSTTDPPDFSDRSGADMAFDLDTYKIIRRYILDPKNQASILRLQNIPV